MLCLAYCCWQLKGWTLKAQASSSMMSTRPSRPFCSLRPLSRDLHRNLVTRSVVKDFIERWHAVLCRVRCSTNCVCTPLCETGLLSINSFTIWMLNSTIVSYRMEANYSSSLGTNPCLRFQWHHPWHTGQFFPGCHPRVRNLLRCQLVICCAAGVWLSYMYWMTSILVSGTYRCILIDDITHLSLKLL